MKRKTYRVQLYDEKKHRWDTACAFNSKGEALFMLMEHGKRARVIHGDKPIKKNYTKFGDTYFSTFEPIDWKRK